MPASEATAEASAQPSRLTNCPDCKAGLAVLRIIPGRAGSEYWTMRCTRCGGIHLEIVGAEGESEAKSPN
jgi:DNA-directed RNA polymerase subunit M/transcription elongation factor TFIIS